MRRRRRAALPRADRRRAPLSSSPSSAWPTRRPRRSCSWPTPGRCARSGCNPWEIQPLYLRRPTPRSTGPPGRRRGGRLDERPLGVGAAVARRRPASCHRADAAPPRRRRSWRSSSGRTRRPWSRAVFHERDRARSARGSRYYIVARVGRRVVGYAGLMFVARRGARHQHRRRPRPRSAPGVGTPAAADAGPRRRIDRGCAALTLEVRVSNTGAQALYRRFGFAPGRRAQALLREHRGRDRDVVPRHRQPRATPTACASSCCARDDELRDGLTCGDRPSTPIDGRARHRDELRRDRGGAGDGRLRRAVERGVEPGRPARRSTAAWCPRSPAGPTSSCSTRSIARAIVEAGVDDRADRRRGLHDRPGSGRRPARRRVGGEGAGADVGRAVRRRQPPRGPPLRRVPRGPDRWSCRSWCCWCPAGTRC